MRFLINSVTPRTTSSSINLNNTEIDVQEPEIQSSDIEPDLCSTSHNIESNKRKQNKQKETDLEKKFMQYLDAQTQKEIVDDKPDEHQHFFQSLLPIVRKFNDDETLIFRTEVLRIAQTIKQTQISSKTIQPLHTPSAVSTHHPQYFYQTQPSYGILYPNNKQYGSSYGQGIQRQTLQHMNIQHNIPTQESPYYPMPSTNKNYAPGHQPTLPKQNDTTQYLSPIHHTSSQHSNITSPSSSNYSNIPESPENSQPLSRAESPSLFMDEFITIHN